MKAMRDYFSVSQSLPQWLVSSVCWTGSCLAGFKIVSYGVMWLWPSDNSMYPIFGLALCICVMMWRRVIRVGWNLLQTNSSDSALLKIAAAVWLFVLSLGFAASVLSIAFGTLMWLALSGEPQSGSWQ